MAQISLYYQTQLDTKVSLLPEHIDGNIDEHLLENLRTDIETKTVEAGIVIKIHKLISYDYGMINKANLMGTTDYKVKYECLLCSPIKDLEMICIVDNIFTGFLIGRNGPIVAAIEFNKIDTNIFKNIGDTVIHIDSKKEIIKGSYLKITVINVNNNIGEKSVIAVCKLLNIASKHDIKKFKTEQKMITDNSIVNEDGSNETDDDDEFI